MKIIVLGKTQRSGVSKKTGKDFCGNIVYYSTPEEGIEGAIVSDVWLDPNKYPLSDIAVGKTYNLEYEKTGFVRLFALA